MPPIDDFFRELDGLWAPPPAKRITLNAIGSGALMIQFAYARGTKDSDVLETVELTPSIRERLEQLAGRALPFTSARGSTWTSSETGFHFFLRQRAGTQSKACGGSFTSR